MKAWRFGALALVIIFVGCGPTTKEVMTKFDASCLTAVQSLATVESHLSRIGELTPAQSLTVRLALRPVIDLGDKATEALIAWQPGQTTPNSLLTLAARLADLVDVIAKLTLSPSARGALMEAIVYAQTAWAGVIAILNSGTGQPALTPDLIGGATCPQL